MMLIDHIATSMLATNSITYNHSQLRKYVLIAVISAIIPDILALIYHPGTIEYLYHRKYTNSVILTPIYAAIISMVLFVLLKKTITFKNIYLIVVGNYYLHILLDHITEYGAPLLYPLSNRIYALDMLHSFDPIYMTISLCLIIYLSVILIKKNPPSKPILMVFSLLYISHPAIMIALKLHHTNSFKEAIASSHPGYQYIATVPKTFWRWRGIAESNDSYLVIDNTNGISINKKATIEAIPSIARNDFYVEKFLEYARHPILEMNGDSISMYNAIYSRNSYNLDIKIKDGVILSRDITGFDLADK